MLFILNKEDANRYGIDVSATFYCEKCPDIQHLEKRIDAGAIEVKDSE